MLRIRQANSPTSSNSTFPGPIQDDPLAGWMDLEFGVEG